MTDLYQAANGYDNEAGFATVGPIRAKSLVMSQGIQYPVYTVATSGKVYADGQPFTVWELDEMTYAAYYAILTILGFSHTDVSDVSQEVTIRTKTKFAGASSTYANYNAICIHRRPQDVVFSLEAETVVSARFEMRNLRAT